jgi:mannose/cellobiose epimerase-like protein (N-acyl-D-glucosamine 2-epimerase family)
MLEWNMRSFLSPFTVDYTITNVNIPTTENYDGLEAMTSANLQRIFEDKIASVISTTATTNQSFALNEHVAVDWRSELSFDAKMAPGRAEVDDLIISAFGQNGAAYQAQLPARTNNIFSTTTSFTFK